MLNDFAIWRVLSAVAIAAGCIPRIHKLLEQVDMADVQLKERRYHVWSRAHFIERRNTKSFHRGEGLMGLVSLPREILVYG